MRLPRNGGGVFGVSGTLLGFSTAPWGKIRLEFKGGWFTIDIVKMRRLGKAESPIPAQTFLHHSRNRLHPVPAGDIGREPWYKGITHSTKQLAF